MFLVERDRIQCENAASKVECPPFERASGDCTCTVCGHLYYDHPQAVPFIWLQILCDGRYVKL